MKEKRKLTNELIGELHKLKSNGLSNKDACQRLMISEVIFYKWRNDAKEHIEQGRNTIEVKLFKSLKEAEAKFKAFHISNINNSCTTDWKASAWMLERKYPNEYARTERQQVEHSGEISNPLSQFSKKELDSMLAYLDNMEDEQV